MSVQVPGKTFLLGEYSVLAGGSALLLATSPTFKKSSKIQKYHPDSAVARFLKGTEFNEVINDYFVGGFGKSSAEFILAWIDKNPDAIENAQLSRSHIKNIFLDYKNLFSNDLSQQPSGADVVGQCLGPVTWFKPNVEESTVHSWPYPELGFYLVATGYKQLTHDHLAQLDRALLADLVAVSDRAIVDFFKSAQDFISSLKNWSHLLQTQGLTAENSVNLKKSLEKNPEILCAKPCGALGADVFFVLFQTEKRSVVDRILQDMNLSIKANELSLTRLNIDFKKDRE